MVYLFLDQLTVFVSHGCQVHRLYDGVFNLDLLGWVNPPGCFAILVVSVHLSLNCITWWLLHPTQNRFQTRPTIKLVI